MPLSLGITADYDVIDLKIVDPVVFKNTMLFAIICGPAQDYLQLNLPIQVQLRSDSMPLQSVAPVELTF